VRIFDAAHQAADLLWGHRRALDRLRRRHFGFLLWIFADEFQLLRQLHNRPQVHETMLHDRFRIRLSEIVEQCLQLEKPYRPQGHIIELFDQIFIDLKFRLVPGGATPAPASYWQIFLFHEPAECNRVIRLTDGNGRPGFAIFSADDFLELLLRFIFAEFRLRPEDNFASFFDLLSFPVCHVDPELAIPFLDPLTFFENSAFLIDHCH
jgi:hypothetical protein